MKSTDTPQANTNIPGRRKPSQGPFRKETAQAEWAAGLFLVLFLAILFGCQLQIWAYRTSAMYLEDALAASNLASAVIDIREYGKSHTLLIGDPLQAYEIYQGALRDNLGLDANWECGNRDLIAGRVTVERYIVYNVKDGMVRAVQISEDGSVREETGPVGRMEAPNGVPIVSTGIYSEISFPVEGFLGTTVTARKGKLVDVTAYQ
ncbi:MAG: hypothetical protein J6C84_03715 [Lachnospiraceae bacterium]|nr:hypothetical protein [Lachnospiraceae bacterium]